MANLHADNCGDENDDVRLIDELLDELEADGEIKRPKERLDYEQDDGRQLTISELAEKNLVDCDLAVVVVQPTFQVGS